MRPQDLVAAPFRVSILLHAAYPLPAVKAVELVHFAISCEASRKSWRLEGIRTVLFLPARVLECWNLHVQMRCSTPSWHGSVLDPAALGADCEARCLRYCCSCFENSTYGP